MAQQESIDHQLQTVTFEALFDTFRVYLQFDAVIPFIKNQEPLNDSHELIHWVLEEDNEEERLSQFIFALKTSLAKGRVVLQNKKENTVNVNSYTLQIIQILDGQLLENLSATDVLKIAEALVQKKLIPQNVIVTLQKMLKTDSILLVCMELFRKIKRGKEDWPIHFFNSMQKVRPGVETEAREKRLSMTQSASGMRHLPTSPSVASFSADSDPNTNCSPLLLSQDESKAEMVQLLIKKGLITSDQIAITTDIPQQRESEQEFDNVFSDSEEEEHDTEGTENVLDSLPLNLRDYQVELAENALKGLNTIICAPTGSGKTRVSTYIILKHLQEVSNQGGKVAFLARTVPLVLQQCRSLKKYLPSEYQVDQVTGESENSMNVSFLLPSLHVIVMTPKVLENHINQRALKLEDFSLIVLDECHHTRKEEPYNTLMFAYLNTKLKGRREKLPQIVGLTASIGIEGASTQDAAVDKILKILGNLDCDNISMVKHNLEELRRTVPVPAEKILSLKEQDRNDVVKAMEEVMSKLEKHVQQHAQDLNDEEVERQVSDLPRNKKTQQYNQWAVMLQTKAKQSPIYDESKETNLSVRSLIILADYLKEYSIALESLDLVQLHDVMQYLHKCFSKFRENEKQTRGETLYYSYFKNLQEELKNRHFVENGNLRLLARTLQEHLINKDDDRCCGIVFVRTRALAFALATWMKRCGTKQLQDLNAAMFTGGAKTDQMGMTQAEQEDVIQQFRDGTTRLLVATTVAEEGLDIPDCNLVIKYNHVGNEVTTMQTRGRSRRFGGLSVLLAMEKVATKERINQGKAKLMTEALNRVHSMSREEIAMRNNDHQKNEIKQAEIKMLLEQQAKKRSENKHFTMICSLCRKLCIKSEDMKTIDGAHRVALDSSLWNNKKISIRPYKSTESFDRIKMLGAVRCKTEPEPGKHCDNHLGSLIIYQKMPFIVLSIKKFGFMTKNSKGLSFCKKWKDVPYTIGPLEPSDIKRYFDTMKDEDAEDLPEVDSGVDYPAPPSLRGDREEKKDRGKMSRPDRDENTEVKRTPPDGTDEGTQVKQVFNEVDHQQTSSRNDSGLFSGNLQNFGSSLDETQLKQPVHVQQPGGRPHFGAVSSEMQRPLIVGTDNVASDLSEEDKAFLQQVDAQLNVSPLDSMCDDSFNQPNELGLGESHHPIRQSASPRFPTFPHYVTAVPTLHSQAGECLSSGEDIPLQISRSTDKSQ